MDFRTRNGDALWWVPPVGHAITKARNFFYGRGTVLPHLRGSSRYFRKGRMPRSSFKRTVRRYNARRKAYLKSRAVVPYSARPRTFVPRAPVASTRRRYRRRQASGNSLSTKGMVVYQKNKYLLDIDGSRDGFSSGSSYWIAYYNTGFDAGVGAPFPVPMGTAGTTPSSFVYGRLQSPLGKHITSSNMATQFTKVKVASISHTFYFPDQAAATTNDKWPLVIWVNHSDKYRVNIDGAGDTSEFTTVEALLERPGWKKYFVKRMNKLTITYTPTMLKTIEQNVTGTGLDTKKMVPVPWFDLNNTTNTQTELCGPTVCFQLPQTFIPAAGISSQYYENAFKSTASVGNNMSTFLEFSTVTVSAKVLFKDPDYHATIGC